jgi:N-methylhydantoinase A
VIALGVDVGGTFTDLALFNEGGAFESHKLLTTPESPTDAIFRGIEAICGEAGIEFSEVSTFVHGTTLIANALI